jgi:signal transduction histidine kinase
MDEQVQDTRYTSVTLEDAGGPPFESGPAITACRAARASIRKLGSFPQKRRKLNCRVRGRTAAPRRTERLNEEFLAVFSHEIRSSLGAIHSAAQLLRILRAETSAQDRASALIERQVGRMTRLIDDLVESSRVRSAELPLRCAQIDLRVLVWQAVETVGSDLGQRNHRLTISLPEGSVWLTGDCGRLEQVLVNLLLNAAKYTDDDVVVRIRDSGIGIAEEALPHVFDLFMRVDQSSRRPEAGFGIGLALVKRLVEMHGGRVTAASAGLGQGSEFSVYLPVLAKHTS